MACANASGSIKLPLVFIHKYENPCCFKNIKDELPVVYYHQRNAWMNGVIFNSWLASKFVPHYRKALQDLGYTS